MASNTPPANASNATSPFSIHARPRGGFKIHPRIRFELNDAIAEGDRIIFPEELEEENEEDKNP